MNNIQSAIRQGYFLRFFIMPLFVIWLIALLFLFAKGYNQSFLLLNSYHLIWLDYPMLILTMLGDAGFMAVLLIFILVKKQPYPLFLLLLTIIVSGLIAQMFKNFVFSDYSRPPYLFKEQVHTVARYVLNHHSFPSGHSTTVAAVFTMIAYFRSSKKTEMIIYAILCPLIAFSRIYLGVHFLGDVIAGIFLGCICTFLILYLIPPYEIKMKGWLIRVLKITSVVAAIIILAAFFGKYL